MMVNDEIVTFSFTDFYGYLEFIIIINYVELNKILIEPWEFLLFEIRMIFVETSI